MTRLTRLLGVLIALALSTPTLAQTITLYYADGSQSTRSVPATLGDSADLLASSRSATGADIVLGTQVEMRDAVTFETITTAAPGAEVNFSTFFNRLDSLEVPFEDLVGRVFVTAVIAPSLGIQSVLPITIEADDGAVVGFGVNEMIPGDAAPGPFPLLGINRIPGFTTTEDTAVIVRFVAEEAEPELVQVGDLISGVALGDVDGRGVDISGDGTRIVLSTSLGDAGRPNGGQVRVFEWDGAAWNQLGQTLENQDPNQVSWGEVGAASLSGDGQRLAIGNRLTLQSDGRRGSIWVYEWIGGQWTQIGATITTPFSTENVGVNGYGVAVALSQDGSRLAAGANSSNATVNGVEGGFTVFEFAAGSWLPLGSSVFGSVEGERLGTAIDISGDGNRVVVGAPSFNDENADEVIITPGRAFVYDWNGSAWVAVGNPIQGRLDGPADIRLGQSVNISQDGARVATFGNFSGDEVRVFEFVDTDWVQMGERFEVTVAFDLHQPMSLTSDGSRIALGTPFGVGNNNGQIAIYDWDGSAWNLYAPGVDGEIAGDQLGWSVVITADGTRAIAGMPGWDDGNPNTDVGGARVFDIR